ncbi:glycerophosphodiester phosphodiesterase family protein [Nocardioides panzhihuensis]|uniref:Glycerophosphoryl diester phosphodiesterase n=1 Tax=Nocardioides panzhihuensis TaxID=860243 RepID=A0A7Z0DMG4_9ACTN|nr:glycerophosphodiester phosphodiesterase family protein [Nocardioides panzhihuensis]NYI78090.1 glycerophosphoryl diester phosphodiesterase [Nocardioides panzhihuensis]
MHARLPLGITLVSLLVGPLLTVTSAAAEPAPNPWLEHRVMNMAHSGGEDEAPTNTMYAFKRAASIGSDMLELDVQSTADDELVVIHDADVKRTTNGTGLVEDLTLEQVQGLDAAYWFVPGRNTVQGLPETTGARSSGVLARPLAPSEGVTARSADSAYPLRGARHGKKVPGYKNKDFRVPTLAEVFREFPDTPINIEIKGTADSDLASFKRTGRLLADFLNKSGRTDVIVASFNDAALVDFHARAPQIGLAPGMAGMMAYFLAGVKPIDGTVAFQVPVQFQGIPVATRAFVERAHADGYAVHVWFSGSAPDDAATYSRMIDACLDGLMPAKPSVLETVLDERGIERPGRPGLDPCA